MKKYLFVGTIKWLVENGWEVEYSEYGVWATKSFENPNDMLYLEIGHYGYEYNLIVMWDNLNKHEPTEDLSHLIQDMIEADVVEERE